MMSFTALVAFSKTLIHAHINAGVLLIWPDHDAPDETDVQLNLSLTTSSAQAMAVTFSTDADGQTPCLEHETVEATYLYSAFPVRLAAWRTDVFWENMTTYGHECFDIQDAEKFSGIIGANILEIDVFAYEEQCIKRPTGLRIQCSSGKEIWSVPGAYGNSVLTNFSPDDFIAPVNVYPIR